MTTLRRIATLCVPKLSPKIHLPRDHSRKTRLPNPNQALQTMESPRGKIRSRKIQIWNLSGKTEGRIKHT